MKLLALVADQRMPNNDAMYKAIQQYAEVDIIKVDSTQQKSLRKLFKSIDISKYDRILMDLHFKRIVKQARFIRTLPNLTIYEEDACQNYITVSKWYGKFLSFYKKLGVFRLVCTSMDLAEKFKKEGLDAHFLAKGYDQSLLRNLNVERDIEMGFVGRLTSDVYVERYKLLNFMQEAGGLQLLRTEPGIDYLNILNRIKVFISADVGLGEYMIKNFEAMACGCLLVAYRQGAEEEALGLEDMKNIVLYENQKELLAKLDILESKPERVLEISNAGQLLAEECFTYTAMAGKLRSTLDKKFEVTSKRHFIDFWR